MRRVRYRTYFTLLLTDLNVWTFMQASEKYTWSYWRKRKVASKVLSRARCSQQRLQATGRKKTRPAWQVYILMGHLLNAFNSTTLSSSTIDVFFKRSSLILDRIRWLRRIIISTTKNASICPILLIFIFGYFFLSSRHLNPGSGFLCDVRFGIRSITICAVGPLTITTSAVLAKQWAYL